MKNMARHYTGFYRRGFSARRRYVAAGSSRWRKARSWITSGKVGYNRGGFGVVFTPAWMGGVAAGVLAPVVHPWQETVMTALAVAPIKLPYGLKLIAQGYVGGRLARPFLGGVTGVFGMAGGASDAV